MDIHVPKRLTYQETKQFIGQHCQQNLTIEDSECNFHWTGVEWVDLPEVVSILNWSTKLIQHGKSVTWTFAHPLSPIPEIDDLRYRARLALGVYEEP